MHVVQVAVGPLHWPLSKPVCGTMPLHKCVKALLLLPVVLAVAVLALFGLALCLDLVQNSFNSIQWVAAFLVSVSKRVAWKLDYWIYEQTGVWFLDSFGKAVAWKFERWMTWTVLPALYCTAGALDCTLVRMQMSIKKDSD